MDHRWPLPFAHGVGVVWCGEGCGVGWCGAAKELKLSAHLDDGVVKLLSLTGGLDHIISHLQKEGGSAAQGV